MVMLFSYTECLHCMQPPFKSIEVVAVALFEVFEVLYIISVSITPELAELPTSLF